MRQRNPADDLASTFCEQHVGPVAERPGDRASPIGGVEYRAGLVRRDEAVPCVRWFFLRV